jgi:2-phospho-L-lactate guanylyltransferase
MKTVLLPVKGFDRAKSRLSSVLEPSERAALAAAMFRDVATALTGSRSLDNVIVVTADSGVAELAGQFGFEIVDEPKVTGHSDAINRVSRELAGHGVSLLALAADLPLLRADEVDQILALKTAGVVLIANREGAGTNGLLMPDGRVIEAAYGAESLERHRRRALSAGILVEVVEVPGVAFDVDTREDLNDLTQLLNPSSHTWRCLVACERLTSARSVS